MREFMNVIETEQDDDAAYDARMVREKNVAELIRHVFAKLGLDLSHDVGYPVNYDEESGREVTVHIEGIGVPLSALAKLETLGVGSDFKITSRGDNLSIEFVVSEDLDHATPT